MTDPITPEYLAELAKLCEAAEKEIAAYGCILHLSLHSLADAAREALPRLIAEIGRIGKERDDFAIMIGALDVKLSALSPHGSCACSYDAPGDVCAHHSPQLSEAQAENDRLRRSLLSARNHIAGLLIEEGCSGSHIARACAMYDKALEKTEHGK